MSNQAGLGAVIRQHNRLIDRDPHALGYLPGHWEFDLSVDNGALDPPRLDLCQSYGAKGDLVSHPCLLGVIAMVIAMRKFLFPTLMGRSCATCVAVAYLVLFCLILWLIFDAEMPPIAAKWHL